MAEMMIGVGREGEATMTRADAAPITGASGPRTFDKLEELRFEFLQERFKVIADSVSQGSEPAPGPDEIVGAAAASMRLLNETLPVAHDGDITFSTDDAAAGIVERLTTVVGDLQQRLTAALDAAAADRKELAEAADADRLKTAAEAEADRQKKAQEAEADRLKTAAEAEADRLKKAQEAEASRLGLFSKAEAQRKEYHDKNMAAFARLTARLSGGEQCRWGDWLAATVGRRVGTYTYINYWWCIIMLLKWVALGVVRNGVWAVSVGLITPSQMVANVPHKLLGANVVGGVAYYFTFFLTMASLLYIYSVVACFLLARIGITMSPSRMAHIILNAVGTLLTSIGEIIDQILDWARDNATDFWDFLSRVVAMMWHHSGGCYMLAAIFWSWCNYWCVSGAFGNACRTACNATFTDKIASCAASAADPAARAQMGGGRAGMKGGAFSDRLPNFSLKNFHKQLKLFLKNIRKNNPACARFAKKMADGTMSTVAKAIRENDFIRVYNIAPTIVGNIFDFAIRQPFNPNVGGMDFQETMNNIIKVGGGAVVLSSEIFTPEKIAMSLEEILTDDKVAKLKKINFDPELQRWSRRPELEENWPEFGNLIRTIVNNSTSLEGIDIIATVIEGYGDERRLPAGVQKDLLDARTAAAEEQFYDTAAAAAAEEQFYDTAEAAAEEQFYDAATPIKSRWHTVRQKILPKGAAAFARRGRAPLVHHPRRLAARVAGGGNSRRRFKRRKKTKRRGRKRRKKRKTRHKGKRKRTRRRRSRGRRRRRHTRH